MQTHFVASLARSLHKVSEEITGNSGKLLQEFFNSATNILQIQ